MFRLWTCRCSFPLKAGVLEKDLPYGKKQEQRAWVGIFSNFPKRADLSWNLPSCPFNLTLPRHPAQHATWPRSSFFPCDHPHTLGTVLQALVSPSALQKFSPHFSAVLQCKGDEPHLPKMLICATSLGLFQDQSPASVPQPSPILKVCMHFSSCNWCSAVGGHSGIAPGCCWLELGYNRSFVKSDTYSVCQLVGMSLLMLIDSRAISSNIII